jgi:hypothetical protein
MQGVQTHIHKLEAGDESEDCKIVQFCDGGAGRDQLMMGLSLCLWSAMVHHGRKVIMGESINALRLDSIDLLEVFGRCN